MNGRHTGRLLELFGIGKALASQRITSEEPPPALLEVEPAGAGGNEDVMDALVLFQPGPRLEAEMTTQVISDDEEVASRIIGFDVSEQGNIALGIACGRAPRQFLAIAHPQRPVHPGFLGTAPIVQGRFDAVPSGSWLATLET